MASLVFVITLRINKDNTVWDTNIVTPAKKNITQKREEDGSGSGELFAIIFIGKYKKNGMGKKTTDKELTNRTEPVT